MKVDVVWLPSELRDEHLRGRSVVVLDVLRATTTMVAALAAGVREIEVFEDVEAAAAARAAVVDDGPAVLCGERNCLPPSGFDLGNSPGHFTASNHAGARMFMCTTNG